MKRTICILLACVLLLAGCSSSEKDWQEQYDLGMRYLREGDYEEAILAFSAAIEIDDSRPEAYMGRAEAYEGLGEHDKALRDYKRARKIARENDDEDLVEDLEEIIEDLEEIIEDEENGKAEEPAVEPVRLLTKVEVRRDSNLDSDYVLYYNDQNQLIQRVFTEYSYGYSTAFAHTYDDLGRLVTVTWGEFGREEYSYDSEGRVATYYYAEGGATSTMYEYDDQGRLFREFSWVDTGYEEVLYTHDEQGRCIGGSLEYTEYNGDAIHTGTVSFTYDPLGRLAEKTAVREDYTTHTEYVYYENCVIEKNTYDGGGWMYVRFTDAAGGDLWTLYVYDAAASVEEEDGYVTRISTADGMEHLFFYEILDNAAEEEETKGELHLHKPLEYEIVREDRSYYDSDGVMRIQRYFDKVVIAGNRPEFAAMNAAIEADMEGFFSILDGEDLSYYISFLSGTDYLFHTADVEVTDNSGVVFSYCISTGWFMGGVYNGDHYGMSFDVATGEPVYLPGLFGVSEAEMCQMMKDAAWAYLSANHSEALWDGARDTVYGYELDDFFYYFRDGELIITFPTYAISYGAAGSFTVPTGLYY